MVDTIAAAIASSAATRASIAEPLELLTMLRIVKVSPTVVQIVAAPWLTVAASEIFAAPEIVALSVAITWLIHRLSIANATKWIIIRIISHAARVLSLRHIVSFTIASSITHHLVL